MDTAQAGPGPDRAQGAVPPAQRVLRGLALVLAIVLVGLLALLAAQLSGKSAPEDAIVARIEPVWEASGPGEGDLPLFDRPMGVAVGQQGRLYVTDSGNNRVCVFSADGEFLFEFGSFGVAKPTPGSPVTYVPGSLNFPVGIDTDSQGNVYVASFYNDSIEVFDPDGVPLRRFPDPATRVGKGASGQDGLGIAVTDVAVLDDRVYATDAYQVLVFGLDGTLLEQWGKPGTGPADLDHPNGIAARDGVVYVSDTNHNRVTAFTPEGNVLWQAGAILDPAATGVAATVELPRGLTVLPDGSVLVADAFRFSLLRISSRGTIIAEYGERGAAPGQMNFANDVASAGSGIAIADKENGRVQMVRLMEGP